MADHAGSDPFSAVAATYDRDFCSLPTAAAQRRKVQHALLEHLPSSGTILDVGCGTGQDALRLARAGFRVLGVDPSKEMLAVAQSTTAPVADRTSFLQLRAEELRRLDTGCFAGILSNFGALNCVEDIPSFLVECRRLLKDDGILVLCLMGRISLWETFALLFRGQFALAADRWTHAVTTVNVGGQGVRVCYHSPGKVLSAARGMFACSGMFGLSILTPPPSSRRFIRTHPRLVGILQKCEGFIAGFRPFIRFADHFVLVLRPVEQSKRPGP